MYTTTDSIEHYIDCRMTREDPIPHQFIMNPIFFLVKDYLELQIAMITYVYLLSNQKPIKHLQCKQAKILTLQ